MSSLQLLRDHRRAERLDQLRLGCSAVLRDPGEEIWLYGSWARGDWDGRSDVDLLAVAGDQARAERLGEALLGRCLADDVICLSRDQWQERRNGQDPHWRGIARDALMLASFHDRRPELS